MKKMQGKIQETFVNQLENVRLALERVASIELDANELASASGFYFNSENVNPELEHRAQKVSERFSENIHIVANEPSLAFYRIQEHVRNTLPQLVEKKHEVENLQKGIQGAFFDTEYAINAVKEMEGSHVQFSNIQELLKNAMFMRQQIKYEKDRKQQAQIKQSMYRSMMRTQTLDVTTIGGRSDQDRRAEFTRSVQLPSTTSLTQIDETMRARSSSLTRDVSAQRPSINNPS